MKLRLPNRGGKWLVREPGCALQADTQSASKKNSPLHSHCIRITTVMGEELQAYRALRQQMLWPPVHAAVDVYRRRRECEADPYELTWRLIHISECVAVTLASAAVARVREMPERQSEYLKLRERCYGLTWNETEEVLERVQGALDGANDKWLEVLQLISAFEVADSQFLTALQGFLNGAPTGQQGQEESMIDIDPLVRAWSQACDVPQGIKGEPVPPGKR
jgi:hypothetical protein